MALIPLLVRILLIVATTMFILILILYIEDTQRIVLDYKKS